MADQVTVPVASGAGGGGAGRVGVKLPEPLDKLLNPTTQDEVNRSFNILLGMRAVTGVLELVVMSLAATVIGEINEVLDGFENLFPGAINDVLTGLALPKRALGLAIALALVHMGHDGFQGFQGYQLKQSRTNKTKMFTYVSYYGDLVFSYGTLASFAASAAVADMSSGNHKAVAALQFFVWLSSLLTLPMSNGLLRVHEMLPHGSGLPVNPKQTPQQQAASNASTAVADAKPAANANEDQ
eukprot:CAMPEP_0202102938 /NCGR_PEP_ID=MMETSP0965-20130614/4593_1 /ASSEMBLY_ACC=CAM_ASM_000507 /TAXON_ID=4773 /ORGANISM="Schizochytrium aggregatum, Strain ATCC28209" /LENGTH=240 /DNA_ID=CAMNT_0048671717 /DNA_START=46 /DNA_END=768 /DNA_ORIENTATION=+